MMVRGPRFSELRPPNFELRRSRVPREGLRSEAGGQAGLRFEARGQGSLRFEAGLKVRNPVTSNLYPPTSDLKPSPLILNLSLNLSFWPPSSNAHASRFTNDALHVRAADRAT